MNEHAQAMAAIESLAGTLGDWAGASARGTEVICVSYRGEVCDWLRFANSRVRQWGRVDEHRLLLELARDRLRLRASLTVPLGEPDLPGRLDAVLALLRGRIEHAAADPFGSLDKRSRVARSGDSGAMDIDAGQLAQALFRSATGAMLTGIVGTGPRAAGVWSSMGHRLLHIVDDGYVDFSMFDDEGRASKRSLRCLPGAFDTDSVVREMRAELNVMARAPVVLAPGQYRAWLAPRAMADLLECVARRGFSERALRTGASSLGALCSGESRCADMVSIMEAPGLAGVPLFDTDGRERAAEIRLIDNGHWRGSLVGPRSAREFGTPANGASDEEVALALQVAPGALAPDQVAGALGTGVSISNLWYLNPVELRGARLTGMSRFASLWVEDGVAVAPLAPVRIDDSLLQLLGPALEGLGSKAHAFVPGETWQWRGWGNTCTPGALVSALTVVS